MIEQDPTKKFAFGRLDTPCLVLDHHRMMRNIERLQSQLRAQGVALNPHLKTAKSIDVARLMISGPEGRCTVSTLREAEYFAAAGMRHILYAVGIAPQKLPRVIALRAQGIDLSIILDSPEQARAVASVAGSADRIPVLIEIDVDHHRSGVSPHDKDKLVEIAQRLESGGAKLQGVLAHAGGSYDCRGAQQMEAMAERERQGAVAAAELLGNAGFPCSTVSIGSTPTAHFASDFGGVTEVRAGNFVFFDLVMAGLGVCAIEDIALSVLTTVIGHQRDKGWIVIDAGWMALSRDRGTSSQDIDQGYGLVCDEQGRPFDGLVVFAANQEHGIASVREGSNAQLPHLPVGTRVRILPNHACATAAQHDRYHVLKENSATEAWPRIRGW